MADRRITHPYALSTDMERIMIEQNCGGRQILAIGELHAAMGKQQVRFFLAAEMELLPISAYRLTADGRIVQPDSADNTIGSVVDGRYFV